MGRLARPLPFEAAELDKLDARAVSVDKAGRASKVKVFKGLAGSLRGTP